MNIIGRIYRTLYISNIKNGFKINLKIKSNFGGVKESPLVVIKTNNEIVIELNENLLLRNDYFNLNEKPLAEDNAINSFEINKSDIDIKKYILIKPDAYNIKSKGIELPNDKFKGVDIPIILSSINSAEDEKLIISIVRLTPFIYDGEEYVYVEINGEKVPIKLKTRETIKVLT